MRTALLFALLAASTAFADDRAACKAGDNKACARIGELKQQGALNADATKNVDKLIAACGNALDAANGTASFSPVSSACNQLFNAELQKGWKALAGMNMPGVDQILGTAYAEAYCGKLATPPAGCNGKKPANFSNLKGAATRTALSALNKAALEAELGAEKAKALVEKFDKAWDKILGAPRG
jgi:hypothetical protein